MDRLTAFGLFAVTAMLVCDALERRSSWFILAFAGSCALGSVYGFLQGAWPFGLERWWAARNPKAPAALRYRTAAVREPVPFLFFSRFGLLKNALDRDASKPHAQINLVRCGRAGEPLPQRGRAADVSLRQNPTSRRQPWFLHRSHRRRYRAASAGYRRDVRSRGYLR